MAQKEDASSASMDMAARFSAVEVRAMLATLPVPQMYASH